jgi:LysM repeat protein
MPTFTPTATPTPIFHVIKKGETILGIAAQYNVSSESLMALNGIENPRTLRIGQTLIIPIGDTESLGVQPTATPTPMPLKVVNLALHRTPVGGMWVMGEVQNDRDAFLDRVQVQMSLYNARGELLERVTSFVAADVVPAHGRAPFALLFAQHSPGSFASHEIVILSAEPIVRWGNRHQYLMVEQVQGEMVEGTFLVEGTAFNPGQEAAKDVQVTLTCYGSEGSVVAVRQIEVGILHAGEGKTFTVSTIPAAPAVSVQGIAWGMKDNS